MENKATGGGSCGMTMGLGCVDLDVGMSLEDTSQFNLDIGLMPENPPKKSSHRRVHSEIIMLPDDLCFDSDLGIVAGEDLVSMYLNKDKINASSSCQVGGRSSQGVAGPALALLPAPVLPATHTDSAVAGLIDKPRIRHQHSQSMDGLSTMKLEMSMSGSEEYSSASDSKKAMSAEKLAELALVDPKCAKRYGSGLIGSQLRGLRKMRYIAELERKIQTLQTEATSLTAQLNLLQRDTDGLMAENNELKVLLQTMEQQVMLQDALNEGLKEKVQQLKALTGQTMSNGGSVMNFPYGTTQYYHNNQAANTLMAAQQFPHLDIHPNKHLQHQQVQHQRRDQQLQQVHQTYQELQRQPNEATFTSSNSTQSQKESDTDQSSKR